MIENVGVKEATKLRGSESIEGRQLTMEGIDYPLERRMFDNIDTPVHTHNTPIPIITHTCTATNLRRARVEVHSHM